MGQITLRPELVTSSGEACGIMLDNQYVGSLTLLYREEDRIWGSVQLDEEVLAVDEKEEIDLFIHRYIENMIDATGAPECFVSATYSYYDHIISTDQAGYIEELIEVESAEGTFDDYHHYDQLEDGHDAIEPYAADVDFDNVDYPYDYDLEEDIKDIELNIVGESRNRVEYQLLNANHELIAEAMIQIDRGDVIGDVFWHYVPTDDEIDEVAHTLVADFDSDLIDTFMFTMLYGDEEIATFELAHENLMDEDEEIIGDADESMYVDIHDADSIRLHLELLRDDGDSLTFDVYEDGGYKNKRIGIVTIDLDGADPSALVDFINPRDGQVREQLAYQLIEELDKETEYHTFTITMQYQDEIIDEYVFDVEEQRDLEHIN